MDLQNLSTTEKANGGVTIPVKDPRSLDPIKGMTLTVLGSDSNVAIAQEQRRTQAALERMAKGKNVVNTDAETATQQSLEDLAEMVIGWEGFEEGGKPLEFKRENVLHVLNRYRWLREQVRDAVNDRALFLGKSSGN